MTNTDYFAAWFAVTGDATPDGIRIVWSFLGAMLFVCLERMQDLFSLIVRPRRGPGALPPSSLKLALVRGPRLQLLSRAQMAVLT